MVRGVETIQLQAPRGEVEMGSTFVMDGAE